jgi:hypothetical protein
MHGYDPAAFAVFLASVTGAAAALTGLLFVAVSINLSKILGGQAVLPPAPRRLWWCCYSS